MNDHPGAPPTLPPVTGSWPGSATQPRAPAPWPVPAPPAGLSYAPWKRRVAAHLIDSGPGMVGSLIFTIGYVVLIAQLLRGGTNTGFGKGPVLMVVGGGVWLLALAWSAYNRWLVEGRGGQSLGKRTMKISLVSLQTGGPVGAANACIRDLVHIVDGYACLGYLWPLWDDRRQTFADKIMNTAVIDSPTSN